MKKNILLQVLALLLSIMIISCIDNRDPFYTKKGGWDYQRIPLIKPYFASKTDKEWLVSFPDNDSKFSKGAVFPNYINVKDSIILILSFLKADITRAPDTTWCFIIVPLRLEAVFSDEQKYLDSLRHYTNLTPTYRNIDSVWEQYSETGYLEWFPDEYKPEQ